jgi:hypothetical protein
MCPTCLCGGCFTGGHLSILKCLKRSVPYLNGIYSDITSKKEEGICLQYSMTVNFIPYNASFKDKALEIFASNSPKYFDPADLSLFTDFLDHFADEHYQIVVHEGVIIGCGGYYVKHETKTFGIAWVMFKRYELGARNFRKISKHFFETIINQIRSENLAYDILINTTQLLERYFHAFGFDTEHIEMNGFGPGLHHVTMRNRMLRNF